MDRTNCLIRGPFGSRAIGIAAGRHSAAVDRLRLHALWQTDRRLMGRLGRDALHGLFAEQLGQSLLPPSPKT
jgi:hypothetical protein